MTTRRELLVALAAGTLAVPFRSLAQPQARVYRIGILAPNSLETRRPLIDIFIRAMHELGYVEDKNIVFEARYASGNVERLAALATELAGQKPDMIVAPNGIAIRAAARAAEQAKHAIPIVFTSWATPVGSGLVASFARRGGNVTGLTNFMVEVAGKQLQLLKNCWCKCRENPPARNLRNRYLHRHRRADELRLQR